MATSLSDDIDTEEWTGALATPRDGPILSRSEWIWTLVGLALLGAFLLLLIDDLPLRTFISSQ
jgi:hypothetical protein